MKLLHKDFSVGSEKGCVMQMDRHNMVQENR
jgi:hypothetical protein